MEIPSIIELSPNRVWRTYSGGRSLDEMEDKAGPRDDHFPEDWIGSTTRAVNTGREEFCEEGLAKVFIEGESVFLKTLCQEYPEEFLGSAHVAMYGTTTHFLLKFLDSAIRLHIQCHPTIPFAKEYLDSDSGKTEAYVILGVRDGITDPYIYMGFQYPPSKSELKRIVEEQDTDALLACFDKIPIQVGDVFLVPGGFPHAIGAGVFMVELMEPTDLVVRMEFERGGYVLPEASRFMGRGIDFALSMFDYHPISKEEVRERFFCSPVLSTSQGRSTESILIDESRTPCFRLNQVKVRESYKRSSSSFYIAIVTKGEGVVLAGNSSVRVKKGSRFFVPAKTEFVHFKTDDEMELLLAFPPKS